MSTLALNVYITASQQCDRYRPKICNVMRLKRPKNTAKIYKFIYRHIYKLRWLSRVFTESAFELLSILNCISRFEEKSAGSAPWIQSFVATRWT